MTLGEQVTFVQGLIENVRKDLLRDCEKWPEHWEGHELRRFIARRFDQVVTGTWRKGQARDFNNECTVRNLL